MLRALGASGWLRGLGVWSFRYRGLEAPLKGPLGVTISYYKGSPISFRVSGGLGFRGLGLRGLGFRG